MRSFVAQTRKNQFWVLVAALVLLVVALVIPQLAWADHASDHPDDQFDTQSSSARWVALGEYYTDMGATFLAANPEVMAYQCYASAQQGAAAAGSISPRLTNPTQLAAYPEVLAYQRSMAAQKAGVTASSARWAALGEYYSDMGATFFAANPEISAHRQYVGQQVCFESGSQC